MPDVFIGGSWVLIHVYSLILLDLPFCWALFIGTHHKSPLSIESRVTISIEINRVSKC